MAKKKLNKKVAIIVGVLLVFFVVVAIWFILSYSKDPMKFLDDARAYVEQNDYEQAELNYGRAFAYSKNKKTDLRIDILFEISEFHLMENEFHVPDWRKTAGCWNQIINLEPKNLKARTLLLNYFYEMANSGVNSVWQMVHDNSSELIEITKESQAVVEPDILLKRARSSLEIADTGQTDEPERVLAEAKAQLEEILSIRPDMDVYLYLGRAEIIKGRIDKEKGILDAEEKSIENTKAVLEKAIQAFPDNPKPQIELLHLVINTSDLTREDAKVFESDYIALTEKFGSKPDIYVAKSTYYRVMGEIGKAIESLERAVELDEQNVTYIQSLVQVYYQKYSIDNDKDAFTKLIAVSLKGLTLPDAQDLPGPRQSLNINNRLNLFTTLSHAYLDAAIEAGESGDEGQREQWLAKARDSIHEIEQILGTKTNVYSLKWQSQLAFAAGDKNEAVLQMYNVYEQLKAADRQDPMFSYRLAQAFADSSEVGARLEFLVSAINGRIDDYKPEVFLETAEIHLTVRYTNNALALANVYETKYSANNRSIAVKARAYILSGRRDEAEEELAKLDADLRVAVELKAELLRNRIRTLISVQQSQAGSEVETDGYDKESLSSYMQEYLDVIMELLQTSDDREDVVFPSGILKRYVRDGKNVQAAGFVNKYLESFPDNIAANLFKKKLSEPDPANVSKERLNQLSEELLAESDKLTDVITLLQLYRLNNKHDKAIQTFEKALQMAPDDKNVIALGFDIALQSDDMDMAEKMLKTARDENIDNGSGLTYAARFDMFKEDYQAALEKVDEYIKLVPVSSYAYLLRSDINDKLGLFEDAITDIETAQRFNSYNPEVAKKYVALLYAGHLRSGSSSLPQQRDLINKAFVRAMRLKTGDRQLQGVYASFVAEEDPERALSLNQQLMKQAPSVKNAFALSKIAVSIAQKEYDQSQREAKLEIAKWACQEALKLEPDNKSVLQSYSNVLRLLGRQDEAASLLEGKHGQLWRFYVRDSQYDKAKEILMELYQDSSQDIDVLKGLILVAKNTEDKDSVVKYSEELLAADNSSKNELLQIQIYLQTGLVEEGSLKLASFRERNPQNSQAMLLETESMMKKGHLDEALELANRNLEMDSENALSWWLRGRIKASLGDYDQAISDYQKSKSLDESVQIRMDLARIYQRIGKLTDAIGELTIVLQSAQAPSKARRMLEKLYKQTGKVEKLEKFYGQTLEKYPDGTYWLVQAGKFYSQQKNFGQAEKLLERAWQLSLEQTGGEMRILDNYLDVLNQAGKLDRLQAIASKYIDTKFAPIAYSYVADAKVQMGNRATSVEYYRKALDKSMGDETLIYGVLMNMSETVGVNEAKRWCNEKLVEEPDSLPVIMVLFKIYSMRGELNKAKEYIDRAIDVVESDDNRELPANFLIEKANIHLRQYMKTSDKQYFNESISVFEKLLVKQPKNASALNNLAYILASNDEQLDRAVEYAQEAHKLAPNNTDYMDTYAYVLCKTGDYEKANQLLQRAVQAFEMVAREPLWDFYEHLGMAQSGIGAIADARDSYEKALDRAGGRISKEDKERLQKAIEQLTE